MPPRIPHSLVPRPTITSTPSTILTTTRTFTTTTPLPSKSSKAKLDQLLSKAPPYPYKIKTTYKQSWFGLYASKHVQFGNNIPEKEYTITRRKWYPNIKYKKLWSFGLGEWVTCKLATNVLRTIDKVGGLDNYLLSEKPARLKELGPWGWELRYRLQSTKSVQRKYQEQRLAMGLITKEQMLEENVERGIAKGVQEKEKTILQVPVKAKDRPLEFAERWAKVSEMPKVLFGEPWRARRFVKNESKRERNTKLEAERQRWERAEAVMARQKAQRRREKEFAKRQAKAEENENMERLAKVLAGRKSAPGREAPTEWGVHGEPANTESRPSASSETSEGKPLKSDSSPSELSKSQV
ncbi:39S ribosomal protein L24, mitochondrial [Orbilia ellipsospora]|uniref:39S ribosomal protein L24, mitochondrial n=1 Tax=Orbilia ellipsospora TaxID=2528407 RepID=A0AAV9X404_9PEZI